MLVNTGIVVYGIDLLVIELVKYMVLVKNQEHFNGGEAVIESGSYRYQDNQFVLVK